MTPLQASLAVFAPDAAGEGQYPDWRGFLASGRDASGFLFMMIPFALAVTGALALLPHAQAATPAQLEGGAPRDAAAEQPSQAGRSAALASDAINLAFELDRPCDAAAAGRRIALEALADRALARLVSAARHCPDTALQGAAIRAWLARAPKAWAPRLQEAFWHLDTGDVAGAKQRRDQLAASSAGASAPAGEQVELLELEAAIALAEDRRTQAMDRYQRILAIAPGHRYARRQTVLLLRDAGGASTAWRQAQAMEQEQPGSFGALELAALRQTALGQQLRWAIDERDLHVGPQRLRELDAAAARLEAAVRQMATPPAGLPLRDADAWQAVRRRLQWDQVLAEVERGRPQAALALHEQLRAQARGQSHAPVAPGGAGANADADANAPFHGRIAVARALALLGRSRDAVAAYEAALEGADEHSDATWKARLGLIYTYADAGRFDDAEALLQRMQAQTPAYLRQAPAEKTPNSDYTTLHGTEADLLVIGDRLEAAQTRFDRLWPAAAMNASFRAGRAATTLARERPEAALAQYEALRTDDPLGFETRVGHAEALMSADRWAAARTQVAQLGADAPDNGLVRRLQASHRAAVAPRLDVDAGGEKGNLATSGRVWTLDSRLSSGLIGDAWRVHAGYTRAQGDTDAGRRAVWHRGALGVGWTRDRWQAEAQLQSANGGAYRHSVAGALRYRAGDAWRLAARYDGDSPDTPWRARAARIGARALQGEVEWVHSERRRIGLVLGHLDFSDGNVRRGASAQWRERWVSTPRLQVETTLAAGQDRHRLQDRPYFSPARATQAQASVWLQWPTWREYDRSVVQGVELSGGRYRQQGFGSGPTWNLRYEHRWRFGPHAQLRYGLSIGKHPYDGERENQRRVYLQLSMPLY